LGNCVVITKRHLEKFSDITPEEMSEFAKVVKDIEKSLMQSFSYDKINWLMLMMKDKHTHFHIIPRYQTPRNFAGIEWKDTFEPDPLLQRYPEVSSDILQHGRKIDYSLGFHDMDEVLRDQGYRPLRQLGHKVFSE
jgi:diadenosine tetraphosphate (Ap4A) HIT family hydrolase